MEVDKETYEKLEEYDKVVAIYFDENGNEVERFDAELAKEPLSSNNYVYYVVFDTSHLSTYAIAGVNEAQDVVQVVDVNSTTGVAEIDDKGEAVTAPDSGAREENSEFVASATIISAILVSIVAGGATFYKLKK